MQKLLLRLSPLFLLLLFFSCAKDQDLRPQIEEAENVQVLHFGKGKPCSAPCSQPDYLNVQSTTTSGATIVFGHNTPTCGYFIAHLLNNDTGAFTSIDPAVSPLVLTGLDPCTSYSIGIIHSTDFVACLPLVINFVTDCENDGPCEAEGQNPNAAWINQFGFDIPGVINYTDNEILNSNNTDGSLYIPSPVLQLYPNTDFDILSCFVVNQSSEVSINMWIDYNNNSEFDSYELVYDVYLSQSTSLCIVPFTSLQTPGRGICGIAARIMISINDGDITDPCQNPPMGQVIDFLVNVGNCGA